MKKLISIFLLVAMLISVIPCVALSAAAETTPIDIMEYDDAKVASNQVYTISSVEGFKKFVELLVSTNDKGRPFGGDHTTQAKDVTFKLMADIDLNPGWDAASYVNDADASDEPAYIWPAFTTLTFASIFDGNGHTVKGICQKNTADNYSGIFGRVYGRNATVKNIRFENCYSESSATTGYGFLFGMVTASANITIDNVYVDARMVSTGAKTAPEGFGGLIGSVVYKGGHCKVNITNTVFDGTFEIKPTGDFMIVGGMLGTTNSNAITIDKCASYVTFKGTKGNDTAVIIGGFLGYQQSATVTANVKNSVSASTCEISDAYYGSVLGAGRYHDDNGTYAYMQTTNVIANHSTAVACAALDGAPTGENTLTKAFTEAYTSGTHYEAVCSKGVTVAAVTADALTGIAAQATLTANNLTGWTATTMGKVLPRALVVNVPGVVETTVEGAATVLHGYQAKDEAGDTFDFRLVATVDVPENVTVEKVGFIITANYGTTTLTKNYSTNTVYNSVTGNTDTGLVAYTATGEGEYALGGDYIFALAITGAPVLAEGAITLEVTTYYVSGEDTVYGETEVFTVTAPQDALN